MNILVDALVTSDPAMILEGSPQNEIAKLFEDENIKAKNYVCISMRDWKYNPPDFEEKIAKTADYIIEKHNLGVIFIPMQHPADIAISERIAAKMQHKADIIRKRITIENTIGIIRDAKFVLAMRLHTLVYAVSMNTPVIAIKYDPKVDGFMEYLKQKYFLSVEAIEEEVLKLFVDKCAKEEIAEKSKLLCEEMREKARKNIEIALELLN